MLKVVESPQNRNLDIGYRSIMRNRHLTLINFYVIFKPIFDSGVTTNSSSSICLVQGLLVNLIWSIVLMLKKETDSIAIKVATFDNQFVRVDEHYL
jgi:hypothetical protein